jgi:putative multiple sugar transport system substrate-binding protein
MNKKLYAILSIFVLAAMVLAACQPAATEAPTEEPMETEAPPEETEAPPEVAGDLVGIVLPTTTEPRWLQDEARFQAAFEELDIDVEILFSEGDVATERANVEDLITKGVQVIIYTPHDSTAAAAAAESARDAGVKVVSYDRLITDTDAVDYYVTFDSIAVGEAQAQYLVDNASGTGNPLYLYAGAATDNNAFLFFEGAWNVLQPKIADGTFVIINSSQAEALQDKAELTRDEMADIIGQVNTEWDFDTARSLAEANLTVATAEDKGDVFILAPNDGTARNIADVFAADTDVTSYVVTGQDAEIASVQYIIDGKQSMTVLKDTRTLSADAIAAAAAFLAGDTPPETQTYNNGVIDVPAKPSEVITVDQSNVQEAIIDSGYWPAEEFTAAAPTEEPMALLVCQVTDVGGIDDKTFNATAWKGVLDFTDTYGGEGKFLESQQQTDYAVNINAFLEEGCDLIVTVGFLLGADTAIAAEANPDQKFAIVDFAYFDEEGNKIPYDNVVELNFATDQAAFLAGYVAAGSTQTGTVGTFGGIPIPPVTVFMDGFWYGVQYYNEQNGTDVQVLGWDPATQEGLFTGNFESTDDGRALGESLMDEGADIIMPVAGPVGLGTAAAVQERGNAYLIGVDTDMTVSAPEFADVILTSVLKNMDVAVFLTAESVVDGSYAGGIFVGTLDNDGVGLAPFNQLEDMVPDAVKDSLADLTAGIIAGDIQTAP